MLSEKAHDYSLRKGTVRYISTAENLRAKMNTKQQAQKDHVFIRIFVLRDEPEEEVMRATWQRCMVSLMSSLATLTPSIELDDDGRHEANMQKLWAEAYDCQQYSPVPRPW
jgi:hypothetical protein